MSKTCLPYHIGMFISCFWLLNGCSERNQENDNCDTVFVSTDSPTQIEDLNPLKQNVIRYYFSTLKKTSIDFELLTSHSDFFNASVDYKTIENDPLERRYLIKVNHALFTNNAPGLGVAAILVHEIKHILDYTTYAMDDFIGFGLWYATSDVRDYERATDEFALSVGCATGLKQYRQWLYEHVPASALLEKKRNYYTPEEIDTWVLEHSE